MSEADFLALVAALEEGGADLATPLAGERVAVLGAGPDGQLAAACALAGGKEVGLFTVYNAQRAALVQAGAITVRGEGPIGSYAIDATGRASIRLAAGVDEAVAPADVVILTGSSSEQRLYGEMAAPLLNAGQTIVLAPGRTFGALEAWWWLRAARNRSSVTVAEISGSASDVDSPAIGRIEVTVQRPVRVGAIPSNRALPVADLLGGWWGAVTPAPTVIHSSFHDGSGLVEVPSLLLGGPAAADEPESPPPGITTVHADLWGGLLSAGVNAIISSLANERRAVAAQWGVRDLRSDGEWPDRPGDRRRPSASEAKDMLRESVVASLVPLASAAHKVGVDVPLTDSLVTLASAVSGLDLATAGRTLDAIGWTGADIDAIRRAVGVRWS